jgi:hypothetical protein
MNLTLNQLEKLVNDYQHDNHDGYVSNTKDWIENWVKDRLPVILDELVCDNCGSHPTIIYTSSMGRFCERCRPKSLYSFETGV